jgi:hypothetical protein
MMLLDNNAFLLLYSRFDSVRPESEVASQAFHISLELANRLLVQAILSPKRVILQSVKEKS